MNEVQSGDSASAHSSIWKVFGHSFPRNEIVFFSQVVLIYIVVLTCIVNLTVNEDKSQLWTALLSSCLGYLLPNPSLNKLPK
jgi:hypothetical protein